MPELTPAWSPAGLGDWTTEAFAVVMPSPVKTGAEDTHAAGWAGPADDPSIELADASIRGIDPIRARVFVRPADYDPRIAEPGKF